MKKATNKKTKKIAFLQILNKTRKKNSLFFNFYIFLISPCNIGYINYKYIFFSLYF